MVLTPERECRWIDEAPLLGFGDYYRVAFQAMGTPCEILFSARSRSAADAFRLSALRWVWDFEAKFSRYRETSLVCEINRAAGKSPVGIDRQAEELFAVCDWYHWMTGGVFDPTSGPLLRLWDYRARPARIPSDEEISRALSLVGWSRVRHRGGEAFLPAPGMELDFGGIGKEYAVDQVVNLAIAAGLENFLVNFGRDLRAHGGPPEGGFWRIGLENPGEPGTSWCGVTCRDGAVCMSGDYARYIEIGSERYGHILDPRTGRPVRNGCQAVTVLAPSCTEAGMLSTTAFILGAEEGLDLLERSFAAEGCIWTGRGLFETRRFRNHVIEKSK